VNNVASQKHQMNASEDDDGCSSSSPVCFQSEFSDVDEECSCGSGKFVSKCHDTHTVGASCCLRSVIQASESIFRNPRRP